MNSPAAIRVTNFAGKAGNPAPMYMPSSLPENVAGGMVGRLIYNVGLFVLPTAFGVIFS